MLRRRAADFCAAGRAREAMAEAMLASAWERALRRRQGGERAPDAVLWTAARATATAAPGTAARREAR
jgi:hypothetical protein